MGKVAIALLSSIEVNQNEIISAIYSQLLEFVNNAVVIDFYANGKVRKIIDGEPEFLRLKQYKCSKWSEMQEKIEIAMEEFDKVIIFKTPVTCTKEVITDMENGIRKDDSFNMGYDRMRRMYERITFVKAISDKEVYQLVIDPREVDFSEIFTFKNYKRVCAWKSQTDKYGPIYEYALAKSYVQEISKVQDLYFIGSVYDDSKKYLFDVEKEINRRLGKRHKGGVFNNPFLGKFDLFTLEDRKKRVGQSMYLYNLMLSRYTTIFDDYCGQFNMVRFMESIICNCVPLFPRGFGHNNRYNNFYNLALTFPDIYDIIKKGNLVVRTEKIYARIHKWGDDKELVDKIKSTDSFEKITSKKKVQQFYNKFLEV